MASENLISDYAYRVMQILVDGISEAVRTGDDGSAAGLDRMLRAVEREIQGQIIHDQVPAARDPSMLATKNGGNAQCSQG